MDSYRKLQLATLWASVMILFAGVNAAGQKMHIAAVAMGTSTQLGRIVNVDIRIREFSPAEDQKILLDAFTQKGARGLVDTLDKMSSKGRLAITGTLGFDISYVREFKMPDGSRKIRFVTDREVRFGEAWYSTRTMDYQLSMGEVIISPKKGKSSGILMPVAMLKIDKEGRLEVENYQNPWELTNIRIY